MIQNLREKKANCLEFANSLNRIGGKLDVKRSMIAKVRQHIGWLFFCPILEASQIFEKISDPILFLHQRPHTPVSVLISCFTRFFCSCSLSFYNV